jgi:uncharacterized sulfatase
MKQTLFERSARAPMIVAGPGVTARNRSTTRIVEFLDIYPTLADLARVSPPPGLQGRSLTPLLKDPRAEWRHPALTQVRRFVNAAQNPTVAGVAANATFMGYSVRTEQWRYTEWDDGKRGVELYDEVKDPDELRNLADDPNHRATLAQMQKLLRSMRAN